MDLYELTSSPATQEIANCARVVAGFANIPTSAIRDEVLDGDALREYLQQCRGGPHEPVFVDFSRRLEINKPLSLLRYIARLSGVDGTTPSDADRAALAAETVVSFLGRLQESGADTAARGLSHFEALLAQSTGTRPQLTYGDALAWYAAAAAVRAFGVSVLVAAPSLRALYEALERDPRIVGVQARLRWPAGPGQGAAATALPPVRTAATPKGPILVTGASGFIASWVVKLLLEKGYTVHATVRSAGDVARHAHLLALPGAEERLRLFEADLLSPGSFDVAAEGCTGVCHCASPFFFTPKTDPLEELVRPAVEGTRNVLRTCIATASVQRVVVTSSCAACYVTREAADHYYTERDWSDLDLVRETKQHYVESKLLAEREAWRLLSEESPPGRGLSLVTVLPTQTLGPLLQPTMNQSCTAVFEFLTGAKRSFPRKGKCFVDVRDVALAHVLALEDVDAEGRYLLIGQSIPWRVFAEVLRETVPGAPVPSAEEAGPPGYPQAVFSLKRTHDLFARAGQCYPTPVEDSIRDCALSMVAKGVVSSTPAREEP